MEADFRRHYGVDLRDLYRDGGGASALTYRAAAVLVDGLPGESLTKTAIRDAIPDARLAELAKQPRQGHGQWSHVELRLAAIEDLLGVLARGQRIVGDWSPVPRPGIPGKQRKRIGSDQLAHLRRLAAEHEQLHGDTSGRGIVLPFAPRGGTETG